jgi:hypothetical protein
MTITEPKRFTSGSTEFCRPPRNPHQNKYRSEITILLWSAFFFRAFGALRAFFCARKLHASSLFSRRYGFIDKRRWRA